MNIQLAGLNFRPREAKDLVAVLTAGHELALEREPDNRFDPFAVRVIDPNTEIHIGYVPRTASQEISSALASGADYKAILVTPDAKFPIISISLPN